MWTRAREAGDSDYNRALPPRPSSCNANIRVIIFKSPPGSDLVSSVMVRTISHDAWAQYKALLPQTREVDVSPLPANLPYQGKVAGDFDYILPDEVLGRLRKWLQSRGEEFVYYFKMESTEGEATDFEIEIAELTYESLAELDVHSENVIVGKDFTWAVFVDHEGALHVSGPEELKRKLATE